MSRRYSYNFTVADNREIARVVKNYNAKIDYQAKKDPQNKDALPEKMTVAALKEIIDTKQDLNRELNSLRRFSQRGAEKIVNVPHTDYTVKTTKWQLDENARNNKLRSQKIKRLVAKDPQNAGAYPEPIKLKELYRESVGTTGDLKRESAFVKGFLNRGSEELITLPGNRNNTKITKYEKADMERRAESINKVRAERLKEVEETQVMRNGQPVGYTRGDVGMTDADKAGLLPVTTNTATMDNTERKYKSRQLRKESNSNYFANKEKKLKENYLQGIKANYNENDPNVKAVIDAIEEMDFKEFYKIFKSFDPKFEHASKLPPGTDLEAYAEELKSNYLPELEPEQSNEN